MVKVAINGFGRIGRMSFRAMLAHPELEIVAINDLTDANTLAYLFKYDSVHENFDGEVHAEGDCLVVNGKKVKIYAERDPQNLPWKDLGVDIVVESTGLFKKREQMMKHINAGAKKVILTVPASKAEDVDATIVMGVNDNVLTKEMQLVSNASCTTNCLAPLSKVLEDNWGIEEGLMSTIHAATAKQKVVDARSMKDWRTGRSSFGNIIPSTTGAAKAVGLVIPSLVGKMTGISYRVPVADVSIVDLNVRLKKAATYSEICKAVKDASETYLKGIIEYVDDEVVSSDFIGDPCTSIFDARQGFSLNDHMFKLISFYDNEYGYSSKVLMLIKHMAEVDNQ